MPSAAAEFLDALGRKSKLGRFYGFQLELLRQYLGNGQASGASTLGHIACPDDVPVKLVTIVENVFRGCITDLVDGSPELKRRAVRHITRNIPSKHIADVIFELDKGSFTLGQVIAKTLPCSRIEHVISAMEDIYGDAFKADLADSRERWTEDTGRYKDRFIGDLEATIEAVARLFAIRHILVHELPDHAPYDPGDLPGLVDHTQRFTDALTWAVTYKLHGPVPRTQSQMNAVAGQRAVATARELAKYFADEPLVTECLEDFSQHAVWNWFAHIVADARSGMSLGQVAAGTMASMLYSTALAQLNEWRLADLQAHPDRFDTETAKRLRAKWAARR